MGNSDELIKLIVNGNTIAFEHLYTTYKVQVYNTALGYVQNVEEAEEVAQDVFLKVHKSIATFKGDASLSTWIYRITINTALNYIKKKKRRQIFSVFSAEDEVPHFDHPGIILENKEKAGWLYKAIDTLPDRQKTAFILCHVEGLPQQEAANIMEISLKALESLLQRAKAQLRTKLEYFAIHQRKTKK